MRTYVATLAPGAVWLAIEMTTIEMTSKLTIHRMQRATTVHVRRRHVLTELAAVLQI